MQLVLVSNITFEGHVVLGWLYQVLNIKNVFQWFVLLHAV